MMLKGRIAILGATGATGRRVVELAAAAGLHPVAVGRRSGALKALAAAAPGEVEPRTATLDEFADALTDVAVVVNGIGPSRRTAARL